MTDTFNTPRGKWSATFYSTEAGELVEVEEDAVFAMLRDEQGRYVADVHALVEEPTDAPLRDRVARMLTALNANAGA